MRSKSYLIPTTLDDPTLFFVWEFDTALCFIVFVVLGMAAGMTMLGFVFGAIITKSYVRLKNIDGPGLAARLMYWYTPNELWLPTRIPSSVREFIGGS